MKKTLLIVLALCFSAWAQAETTPQATLSMLLEEIRDPVIQSNERRQLLDYSRKIMSENLAQELGIEVSELGQYFIKHPIKAELLLKDPWYDVQTQFYTTLHLENYRQRWIYLQKLHQFSEYGQSLNNTMMARLGHYSPVQEGRFYNRWNKIEIKANNKVKSVNIPYFLMSQNIKELIQMEAHTPYENIFPNKDSFLAFQEATTRLSRIEKQQLAERVELNRRIYIRAVANSAKTLASIRYLTGDSSFQETEKKVTTFLDGHCQGCSSKEKIEYQQVAMVYVESMKKTMPVSNLSDLTKDFCHSLKNNDYYWNIEKHKPAPLDVVMDARKLSQYYLMYKLKNKNREALAKTMLNHDMGILFLTGSLNVLDKGQEPIGTNLGCMKETSERDTNLVKAAIQEAEENIEEYVTRINLQIKHAKFDMRLVTSGLEYFVQTNQSASIEAAAAFPQGIGYILQSVAELDRDATRRKKTDKVIAWGGTILGLGLTISGIGAPEGVAVLLTTAGIMKGLSSGSYYLVRSQQEKMFAKELRLAKNGAAGLSDENLKMHFKEYKRLKISYIKDFAGAGLDFIKLHRMALVKTNGDIKEAHTLLKRVGIIALTLGQGQIKDKIQELIIQGAVEASP